MNDVEIKDIDGIAASISAYGKSHFDLGYEISQIDGEVPDVLVRDDIELLVYVSAHVT